MQQMARQHDGETEFISQPLNQHSNLAQSLRIKSVSRFIQNDELRIRQQSLCDTKALTHSMRVDAHGIASTLAQAHDLQNHFNPLSLCAAGHGREHSQVLSPGKIRDSRSTTTRRRYVLLNCSVCKTACVIKALNERGSAANQTAGEKILK